MALGIHMRKITPLYPKRVFMQWDLDDPTEDGSYTFKVERSAGTEGPWEVLIAGAQNIYNYIDDFGVQPAIPDEGKPHLHSLSSNPYYRVTVIPPSGCANSAQTEPHGLEPELDPVARGLRRRLRYDEGIVFKRLNGVRLALLKRRTWGERCPDCYDSVTRATTREQCTTCYGTSFVGGYWAPVVVWGRVNTTKAIKAQFTDSPRATRESATHVITLLDIPLLQDNDVIVETQTNDRHIVREQVRTELRRRSVHQQVTTSLMERGSVEYRIPVDLRAVPPLL